MRKYAVVFTPPAAYNGNAIACKRNNLQLGLKQNALFTPNRCLSPFSDDCSHDEDEFDEIIEKISFPPVVWLLQILRANAAEF